MGNKIKIIAYYLPQFHPIPENDKWWGKGFTEWNNVKNAKPLYEGHNQPRVPLNDNYYSLEDVNVMRWQVSLAKEYGLYGFCFYHYWFNGYPLLEKPLLNFLRNKDIDFPFCFSWANESWTNGWASPDNKVILKQNYGDKTEWKKHFEFILPFLKDDRYIKEDGCPLFIIYRPYLCPFIVDMFDYWKELCIENGFNGIKFSSQRFEEPTKYKNIYDYLDYHIDAQPNRDKITPFQGNTIKIKTAINETILKTCNIDLYYHTQRGQVSVLNYDDMWRYILSLKPESKKTIAGAFIDWDNSPRYKQRGSCFEGVTPEKFEYYLSKQIKNVEENYSSDYLFFFAWNEWGEGGYLEPDEKNGLAYLKAIKNALSN